jgi:hypothetical protein
MKRTTNTMPVNYGRKKNLSLEEVVDKLIAKGMKAIETRKLKVTIADLIRVSERQKELAPELPLTGETNWIDG